jgi:hypothetical protein
MRLIQVIVITIVIAGTHTSCHAGCNCDDWMKKGGYCVDYIKTKIPTFPIPQNTTEIAALKNKGIPDVSEGDVAMFYIRNYWHVAYVENVHLDQHGNATSIDVSEMNFGGPMSFREYKNKWRVKSRSEWKRALCCGVTDNYAQTSSRKNVALNTVKQIWSPVSAVSEDVDGERNVTILDKMREVFNRFFLFTEREL